MRTAAWLAVLLVYVLTGKLGLAFAFMHASASPVWPPAGIALAALLLLGYRVWPAIFAGAFIVNVTTAGSAVTSLGIATGNTLEALLGAYLVRRFAGGAAVFERAQDIFKLAALAAVGSTTVSATLGVASLALTGYALWSEVGSIWLTWWLGDASGILLVTPFIVLWGRSASDTGLAGRPREAVALFAAVVATSMLVFGGVLPEGWRRLPTAFVCIPPLLWAAYRFGPRTTSTALLALSALAVAGTLGGSGPFAARAPTESLALVQAFLGTMALTALPLAAVVSERRRADERNRVLADIARSISASLDIDTVLPRIADGARALCGSETAAILLRDETSDVMVPRYRVGPWPATDDTLRIRRGDGLGGQVMETGRPRRTVTGAVALMVVPVLIAKHVAGLLYISNESGREFSNEDEAVSIRLAEQAAIAIQNAGLFAREEAARAEAEAANRSKDTFLAMLSHELRNPLGAISNAVHVLERVGDAPAATRARDIIARQAQHLGRLVDDLLDVSRATTGKIVLRREIVDLVAIVERVVASLAARQPATLPIVFVDAQPVRVDGDAVRLEQVVSNLLENAVKYTPAGGRVTVSVCAENGAAVFVVEDSGVGIAPELLPQVFDLFVQADHSLDRAAGGLGIGLTLVRQIVELHGGTVHATSAGIGRGSRFAVRLPIAMASEDSPASPPAQPARTQRILVVEDNDDAREMLCRLIRLLGHEVHEAEDGGAAVDTALRLQPDLTLVDIGLPGTDGYEVARRIRAEVAGRRLRLVALTGYGRREDRERALAAGFDEHLVKPIDPARLAAMLSADRPSCDPGAHMKSSPDGGHQ